MKLLVLVLLLSGCAAATWTHPTKSEAELRSDTYECDRDAVAYVDAKGATGNIFMIAGRKHECMTLRGWAL